MNAPSSKSCRSCHSSRSSSFVSNGPSRLHKTRCCGTATGATVSICKKPSLRTVDRTSVALPSSSGARTAIRGACARLTTLDFATFALSQLPSAPARVLEAGCGWRGGITPALLAAGYDVLGIDPHAPTGDHFRSVSLEQLEEES